jgi:hypothetical protein
MAQPRTDVDEEVPVKEKEEFLTHCEHLKGIKDIRMQMCYFKRAEQPVDVQLNVFGDASETALCAVAYLKGTWEDGTTEVAFLLGKARVAPLKQQTIPKLELMAAVLAKRIKHNIEKETTIPIQQTVLWSDSSTMLQWLRKSHEKQTVFVSNRVHEILQATTLDEWRFVPGALNPADCGTRGDDP